MSIVKLLDSRLGHHDGILKSVCPDMGNMLNMVLPRKINFRSRFSAKIDDVLRKIYQFLPSIFYFLMGFDRNSVNGVCFEGIKSVPIWATTL